MRWTETDVDIRLLARERGDQRIDDNVDEERQVNRWMVPAQLSFQTRPVDRRVAFDAGIGQLWIQTHHHKLPRPPDARRPDGHSFLDLLEKDRLAARANEEVLEGQHVGFRKDLPAFGTTLAGDHWCACRRKKHSVRL